VTIKTGSNGEGLITVRYYKEYKLFIPAEVWKNGAVKDYVQKKYLGTGLRRQEEAVRRYVLPVLG
jgi:hypothetical protein